MQVTIKSKGSYAEEDQPNPLQWYILKKTGDTTFENVSAPIICKDFFNDLAYTLQTGHAFSIYGFNAGSFKLPKDEPVYMFLTKTTKELKENYYNALLPFLEEQKAGMIGFVEVSNGILICIDRWYFENVYRISLVSLIIRLLNIEHAFKDFEEVKAYKKFPSKDQYKWDIVVAKNKFFAVPAKLAGYLWYCGPKHNSDTVKHGDYQLSSLVHNNGVLEWSKYL